MDIARYHAIRRSAAESYENGDTTALAAILVGGDMIVHSCDWTGWNEESWLVFGILNTVDILKPSMDGRAVVKSREFQLCCDIHERDAVLKIAKTIWSDIE